MHAYPKQVVAFVSSRPASAYDKARVTQHAAKQAFRETDQLSIIRSCCLPASLGRFHHAQHVPHPHREWVLMPASAKESPPAVKQALGILPNPQKDIVLWATQSKHLGQQLNCCDESAALRQAGRCYISEGQACKSRAAREG